MRPLLPALPIVCLLAVPPAPGGAQSAREAEAFTPAQLDAARVVRERALEDDTAYELLRSLTTEVGPRPAGSEGDRRAVAWAVAKLKALGFANVRAESVWVPQWIRGEARAEIVAPWPQKLLPVALGGCAATGPEGIEADVVPVTTLDELAALPPGRVKGKIVFFTGRMERTRDGAGYGRAVTPRSRGAAKADSLGAVAMVMRSAGTSSSRLAHTGGQSRSEGKYPRIPGMALSNPDADMLEQQLATGRPVRLRVWNTSQWGDSVLSANVVGEMPGRDLRREHVLLGAHLDSWDLGTGAHDDGAGVAIVTAAARLVGAAKPRRTIRVVLFANEEFGLTGARAYARRHEAQLSRCVLALESDLGAFPLWGYESRVPLDRLPLVRSMAAVVEPLGMKYFGNQGGGGADIGELRDRGVPVMDVDTDAEPYFDLHHTANDTFDKVDPELVRRNVAAYASLAYLAAQAGGGFGRLEPKKP